MRFWSPEDVPDKDLPHTAGKLNNLADDLGETNDVAAANPKRVAEMAAMLEAMKSKGGSRP